MAGIRELARVTGFSRDAIRARVSKFNLGDDPDPKRIFKLIPLSDEQERKVSLEESRTELAVQQARVARLNAEKMEGRLADVDELMTAENELLEGIASIIRSSDLDDGRKDDIFTAIRDHGRRWADGG